MATLPWTDPAIAGKIIQSGAGAWAKVRVGGEYVPLAWLRPETPQTTPPPRAA